MTTTLPYYPVCPQVRAQMESDFLNPAGILIDILNIESFFAESYGKNNYTDDNVRNFLFKIDSIHDFTGDRAVDLNNYDILKNLKWYKQNDEKYNKKVQEIFLKTKDLETVIFLWLIQYVYPANERMKKVSFKPSIQNFLSYEDVKTSNFTIDASLKEYNIFKTLFTSINTVQIAKARYGNLKFFLENIETIYEKTKNEFNATPETDTDIIRGDSGNLSGKKYRFILFCLAKNLYYCYNKYIDELTIDYDTKTLDWKELFDYYYDNQTHNLNYNIKINYYFNNKPITEILNVKNDNLITVVNEYIKYANSYTVKLPKNKYNPPEMEIADLKLDKSGEEGVDNFLFSGTTPMFKIIAPQKFDANRTTGGSGVDLSKIEYLNGCIGNNQNIEQNKVANCSFNILEDTCLFYTEIDDKNNYNFTFEIVDKTDEKIYWPINKVIVTTNKDIFNETYTGKILDDIGIPKDYKKDNKQAYIGLLKQSKKIDDKFKFRYYPNLRILVCNNGPGVSELVEIYKLFNIIREEETPKTRKKNKNNIYGDSTNVSLDENIVLRNILQIKRAGDYSQIWFCKKWNASKDTKLFFMSNDRVSASFCLLEGVPYIGQVSNYNFYFNPYGPDLTAIENIQTTLRTIGYNIGLYDLLKEKNEEILDNHNELCDDTDVIVSNMKYDRNYFRKYLLFVDFFKNYENNDMEFFKYFLSFQTNMIVYQKIFINNFIDCTDIIQNIITNIDVLDRIKEQTKSVQQVNFNENFSLLYSKIIELYNSEESPYKKEFIDDIRDSLGLKNPDYYSIYETKDDISEKNDQELEEEAKQFLRKRNIKEVIFPTDGLVIQQLRTLQNTLPDQLECNNLVDQISYLTSDYDLKYKTFLTTQSDKDQIDWDKEDLYTDNYKRLYNCFLPVYKKENEKGKTIIKNMLPDETFDTETFGFSFENGLTYYHINKNTPSVISTKPYKHSNKTYIMDKNGVLTISGNTKEGTIKLDNRQTKSLSYTDGTEISYYKF
jgi:hypothetical protein